MSVAIPDDAQMLRLEQATLWLQRIRSTAADERLMEEWLDWCQRDVLNQQAFDQIAAVWDLSGRLPAEQPAAMAPPVRVDRGRRYALAAALAGFTITAALGVWWNARSATGDVLLSDYASHVGAHSIEVLADGSTLEMGGSTRVSVALGSHARRVDLHEGEVYVAVRHDTARPFSVDAGRLAVTATGTAFNVQRSADRTTVTVVEGSVSARYEGASIDSPNVALQAGQQLVFTHATHSVAVREADTTNAIAWRTGLLHFRSEPLSDVIATVNRYSPRRIVIEDANVRGLLFTGTARTDSLDGWLRALPHAFPVAVTDRADGSRLIGPRAGESRE